MGMEDSPTGIEVLWFIDPGQTVLERKMFSVICFITNSYRVIFFCSNLCFVYGITNAVLSYNVSVYV